MCKDEIFEPIVPSKFSTPVLSAEGIISASRHEVRKKDTSTFDIVIGQQEADGVDVVVDRVGAQSVINKVIEDMYLKGGGIVQLLAGTYWVSNNLVVFDNVKLMGSGIDETIIKLVDNAQDLRGHTGIVRFVKPFRYKHRRIVNASICDLTIDGNRNNQDPNEFDGGKKFGIYAEGDNLTIQRVKVVRCPGYGFDPHGRTEGDSNIPTKNLLIEDCISEENGKDGFTLDRLEKSIMRNCISRNNDRHGINVVTQSYDVKVYGNFVHSNSGNGLVVQHKSNRTSFENNTVYSNKLEGVKIRGSDEIIVSGNCICNNGRGGMQIRGAANVTITSNEIQYNDKNTTSPTPEINIVDYFEEGLSNHEVVIHENNIYSNSKEKIIRYRKKNAAAIASDKIFLSSNKIFLHETNALHNDVISLDVENAKVIDNEVCIK